jgi:hypothetical protein
MSDISIDAREDDDVDIAVRNLELDFVSVSIGDVEIDLTWEQGAALHRGLGNLFSDGTAEAETDARNTSGPSGTHGCACPCPGGDAGMCTEMQGGSRADPCECICHDWGREEAEAEE